MVQKAPLKHIKYCFKRNVDAPYIPKDDIFG